MRDSRLARGAGVSVPPTHPSGCLTLTLNVSLAGPRRGRPSCRDRKPGGHLLIFVLGRSALATRAASSLSFCGHPSHPLLIFGELVSPSRARSLAGAGSGGGDRPGVRR